MFPVGLNRPRSDRRSHAGPQRAHQFGDVVPRRDAGPERDADGPRRGKLRQVQRDQPVPGQFVGLETRTDALYFAVVTMATIGYGDIHPVGQLSRVLVMVAVLFQFVFVTTLISTITRRLRLRDTDEP